MVDRVRRFCKPHKEEGHVNVESKMCEADGCEKVTSYGSEVEDLLRFCKPHSSDGDVLLQKLRCVAPGRRPAFVGRHRGRQRGAALHGAPGAGEQEPGGAA